MGEQLRLQLLQSRRRKLFGFNATQDLGERIKVFVRLTQAGKDLFQNVAQAEDDAAVDDDEGKQRRP